MKSYKEKVQTLNKAYSQMRIAFLDYAAKKSTSKKDILTILKMMEGVYTKKKAQYYLEEYLSGTYDKLEKMLRPALTSLSKN